VRGESYHEMGRRLDAITERRRNLESHNQKLQGLFAELKDDVPHE
jgi:hypothetical protein